MGKLSTKLLVLAFCPLLLTSCGGFDDLERGARVDLTPANVKTYVKTDLKCSLSKNFDSTIKSIHYTFKTSGYVELSYYQVVLTVNISYDYLGDDGNYATSAIAVTAALGKDGNFKTKDAYLCNYRNVTNVGLGSITCSGYVVKK